MKVLIVEMKEEIAEMQRLKAEGTLPPRESEKSQKKTKKSKRTSKKNPPARVPSNRYPCRWTFVSK